jgi:hypothetical protein
MFDLHPKVQNAGVAAGIVSLVVWVCHDFFHIEMPPEAAAGLTGLIGALTGYRSSNGEQGP